MDTQKGEQFIVLARLWSSDGKGPRSGGQQPTSSSYPHTDVAMICRE